MQTEREMDSERQAGAGGGGDGGGGATRPALSRTIFYVRVRS